MLKNLLVAAAIATTGATTTESFAQDDPAQMFALNLYHEARSQGRDGMIAVGWVVKNRIADPTYPDDAVAVITQKRGRNCEWGWWCDGKSDKPTEEDKWVEAQAVTAELLSENPPEDPTGGALWFHETFRNRPGWMGDNVALTVTLDEHHFYGWAD